MIPLFLAAATATTTLFAAGGARIHPTSDTAAVRAQAGLTQSLWGDEPYSLVLELDAAFAAAERGFSEGDVRLFLVSGIIALEARHDFSLLQLGIGPRFELGWGRVDGSASSDAIAENGGAAFVFSSALGVSLRAPLASRFGLSLLLEAGFIVRGIEAVVGEEATIGWRGSYLSATAGLWVDL
jgi:hypothetical protein